MSDRQTDRLQPGPATASAVPRKRYQEVNDGACNLYSEICGTARPTGRN